MPQARQAISKAILLCSKADHYTPLSNVLVDKLGYKRTCFLQKLHAWSQSASGAEVDGAKWVYNTYDEWAKQTRIPNSTLRVLIKKLEETGIVISANLNKNKQNKTKWYTINYEKLKGIMQENQSAEAHLIETVAESMPIISNIVKDNSQAVLKEVQQIDQKGKCSKEKTDEFVKPLLSMLGIPWSPLKDSFYSHFNDKLIEHFGNGDEGFDKFKAYCMAISQNELLMGKKPMRDGRYFKINLKTILSQKFINNYSEGEGFFSPLQATGEDMGRKTAILAKEFPTITLKDVKDTAETSFDQSVKADLFQSLGEKIYKSWFKQSNFIAQGVDEKGTPDFVVDSQYGKDYILTHFGDSVKKAFQKVQEGATDALYIALIAFGPLLTNHFLRDVILC